MLTRSLGSEYFDLVCVNFHVAWFGLAARREPWGGAHLVVGQQEKDGCQSAVEVVERSGKAIGVPKNKNLYK
jgi:hypothetical protein